MKNDMNLRGELKCIGVVLGILDTEGNVDVKQNFELINIARKWEMSVMSHLTFNYYHDFDKFMEDVIS